MQSCERVLSRPTNSPERYDVSEVVLNPERVRLARELREWTQADLARHIGVSPAAISQLEAGTHSLSSETAERLTRALRVPNTFLGLPLAVTHEGFFRSLRRTSVTDRRKARALAHVAHDLGVAGVAAGHMAVALPRLLVSGLDASRLEVEHIAAQVRNVLGVPAGPIPDVVGVLESCGVLVIRLPLDSADVDAFSLPFKELPVVVLGADKGDRARSRFDAAHEFGHLVLHGEHVWGVKEVEQQAHWFAAAFLMPAKEIEPLLPTSPDWACLFALKAEWEVSLAALLMRARTLGRMTEAQYLTAVKAASARGWRRSEPIPLGEPEAPKWLARILRSPAGVQAAASLPRDIVESLAAATAS
jgi:Zn-dependent peptidase ImmA (M78 family)/transcriptional regulator with XRE-family HTH domain